MPPGFVPPKPPKAPKAPKPSAPKITKPKAPAPAKIKPIDPNQVATNNAMSAFRTALAQLQSSTPAVDSNAIYAPYRASEAVTGQLGQGLQTAVTSAGQAAQTQYGAGLAEAQKNAAQFGISAGAGANPTALTGDTGGLIAQQTQAQAAAAPMAATAWQQLLERSAGAKVADAQLQRQNSLVSGEQQLSAGLPSAIQNEKQLGFQQDTAKKNFALAVGTAADKRTNDLRDYLLGATKAQTSANSAATNAEIKKASLAQKTKNDAAKLRVSQDALAVKKTAAAQKTATAKGIQGISQVNSFLKTSAGAKGAKPITGYKVTYLADPNGISAGGPPVTLTVKDPNTAQPPSGYTKPPGSAATAVYGQATAGAKATLSLSKWTQALAQLKAANKGRGIPDSELIPLLPPKPKK